MNARFPEIRIPAEPGSLARLVSFLGACADESGCDATGKNKLQLAAEEAFINICSYAYPQERGDVTVSCGLKDGLLFVEMIDEGIPFDLISVHDPDVTLGLDERSPGGLGIYFIKKLTGGRVTYRRENRRNILRLDFSCRLDAG
ncbi:MAG: ATP-binding protein [Chlorobiaceae bacterium]|nr:ATP-binding protein [Chlorobiaceae bacterium]NTW09800.1 ATP-binding protein [Chlorobiaceae bacterium]